MASYNTAQEIATYIPVFQEWGEKDWRSYNATVGKRSIRGWSIPVGNLGLNIIERLFKQVIIEQIYSFILFLENNYPPNPFIGMMI